MSQFFIKELPLYNALQYAIVKHANQWRRKTPYVTHCIDVATRLWELGVRDDALLVAALLHDVVEDTDTPLAEIGEKFGPRVMQLVGWLTLPKDINHDWSRKKQYQLESMKVMDHAGVLIKICDKTDNVASFLTNRPSWPQDRIDAYVKDAEDIVGVAQYRLKQFLDSDSIYGRYVIWAAMRFGDTCVSYRVAQGAALSPVRNCGDCGAEPGAFHVPGCDVERCPRCGDQSISCDCVYEMNGMKREELKEKHPEIYMNGATNEMLAKYDEAWGLRRLPWTGRWPGELECEEFGFWCVGPPWRSVTKDAPGTRHDLNRLARETTWDPVKRKRVLL